MFLYILTSLLPVLLVDGQTTHVTKLVYHTSLNPWRSASRHCRELDPRGRLVTVDTAAKADLIGQLKLVQPWEQHIRGEYWLGLHNVDTSSSTYKWAGDCSELGYWNNWAADQPSMPAAGNCIRNTFPGAKWKLADCTQNTPFICEIPTDDYCYYEGIHVFEFPDENTFKRPVTVKRVLMNDTLCDIRCLEMKSGNEECWMWRMDREECVLYISENVILMTSNRNATSTVFRKVCFIASVSTEIISYGVDEIDPNPDECGNLTIAVALADSQAADAVIEQVAVETTTEKKSVVVELCECFCDTDPVELPAPTLSPAEKHDFVIHIVQSLTLNRSEISAIRRKFISVSDSRPSARRVGVLGIVLLSVVFGGILILDMNGLVRDLKIMYRNIRSGLGYKDTEVTYRKDFSPDDKSTTK